jgi:hypothetical protein
MDQISLNIRNLVKNEIIRVTQHAQQEMIEEDITLEEVKEALYNGEILENYPEHRRGSCCLINGNTNNNRPLHIVCTTQNPILIVITVYEPKLPKWLTAIKRRQK